MAYRLPLVEVIQLVPQFSGSLVDKSQLHPDQIKRIFAGKTLLFTTSEIVHQTSTDYTINCEVYGEFKHGISIPFTAVFNVTALISILDKPLQETLINRNDCITSPTYGIRLSSSVQVVLSKHISNIFVYSPLNWIMQPTAITRDHEDISFNIQPSEVISALCGCASNVFNQNESKKDISGSLLLIAPSGSGATTLVQGLARRYGASLIRVTSDAINAKRGMDGADRSLHDAVQCALAQRPAILLLDDLERLTPRQTGSGWSRTETEANVVKIVTNLLHFVRGNDASNSDSTSQKGQVHPSLAHMMTRNRRFLVVGVVTSASKVDAQVADLFANKVHVPLPTAKERKMIAELAYKRSLEVFRAAMSERHNVSPDQLDAFEPQVDVVAVADTMTGVPAVELFCRLVRSVTPTMAQLFENKNSSPMHVGKSKDDAISAAFSAVSGHAEIKRRLVEVLLWPRMHADLYREYRVSDFDIGILLFGPPGTGKTLLPRVLSAELKVNLLNMKLSDIIRGEIGTSEKAVVSLFNEAKRVSPCIVFIDEFQALFTARQGSGERDETGSSLSSSLANCFDDLKVWNACNSDSLVHIIAASNEPWAIDKSFVRPGRFSVCMYVGTLDEDARADFITQRLVETLSAAVASKNDRLQNNQPAETAAKYIEAIQSFDWIRSVARRCDGYSGADMSLLFKRAQLALAQGVVLNTEDGNNPENEAEDEEEDGESPEELAALVAAFLNSSSEERGAQTAKCDEKNVEEPLDYLAQLPSERHFLYACSCMEPSVSVREVQEYLRWDKHERRG